MTGNAAEWCHDEWQIFEGTPLVDPVGRGSGVRMICGYPSRAFRFSREPDRGHATTGVRLLAWGVELSAGVQETGWGALKRSFMRRGVSPSE